MVAAYQLIVNKSVAPCVLDGYNFLLHVSVMLLGDVSCRGRCQCFVITQHTETGLSLRAPGTYMYFLGCLLPCFNIFSPLFPKCLFIFIKILGGFFFLSANNILFVTQKTQNCSYRWGLVIPGSTTRAACR